MRESKYHLTDKILKYWSHFSSFRRD